MYPLKIKSKKMKLSGEGMEVQMTPWHLLTMDVFHGLVELQLKKNIECFLEETCKHQFKKF